jgi:AcrR family transcriptional regulator
MRCFAEGGYHATSMDDLVAASGLSKGSLYWHFESKEDVFLALFDAFLEDYFAGWSALDDGQRPLLEVIGGGGELLIRSFAEDRSQMNAWVEFLAHPAARERFAAAYEQSRDIVEGLLERAIARGEIRAVSAPEVAAAFIAAGEGILLQAYVDPAFPSCDCWPHVMDVWKRGLLP